MKITKKKIIDMFPIGTKWACINSKHAHLCGIRTLVSVVKGEMCWELEDGKQPWMKIPTPDEVLEVSENMLRCKLGPVDGHTLTFTRLYKVHELEIGDAFRFAGSTDNRYCELIEKPGKYRHPSRGWSNCGRECLVEKLGSTPPPAMPPDGYRYLASGEVMDYEDLFWSFPGQWGKSYEGGLVYNSNYRIVARKIEAQAA